MKPTFLCHLLTVPSLRCMNSHPFSWPCFRIIGRSSHGFLGDKRWVFVLLYVFLCAKNYIEYINLTCSRSSTQVSGQNPPTTHLICRVWFQVWVAGGGSFTCVEQMPILVYWVECWSNIITPSSTCSIPAKSTKTSTSSKPHSFWLRYELQGEVSFMGK